MTVANYGGARTIPTRVGRTAERVGGMDARADHPHAGGENNPPMKSIILSLGPSPRGWGERAALGEIRQRHRTIPTRVGRTSLSHPLSYQSTDHPHAGGENSGGRGRGRGRDGPSPRGWGEPVSFAHDIACDRTIPTRVGRTSTTAADSKTTADHPHAGGENDRFDAIPFGHRGPSPRGWGERCRGPPSR